MTEVRKLYFERILDDGSLEKDWFPTYEALFEDPSDRESYAVLKNRLVDPDRNAFHILRVAGSGRVVGLNLLNFDPSMPGVMYCPYGGVVEDLRGAGLYPLMTQVSDTLMRAFDATYCLNDCEDPARVPDYMDVPGMAAQTAARRINFFRRSMNVFYVDDPEIPYVRPSSRDEREVQAYDLLGIRALNNDFGPVYRDLRAKGLKAPLFSHADPSASVSMSKEAYRLFYLEMTRLQFGNLSEAVLRERFPAVEQFLKTLDASSKSWVRLVTRDIAGLAQKPEAASSGIEIKVRVSDRACLIPQQHPATRGVRNAKTFVI